MPEPVFPGETGFDPFTAPASPELVALLGTSPAVDGLLSASVHRLDRASLGRTGHARGEMRFEHFALRGPPNRLHGGLQCVARTLLVAHGSSGEELHTWPHGEHFPCAFWLRIGAPIPLRQAVPFEAWSGSRAAGRPWLVSRFLDTPRLEAALWARPLGPIVSDALRQRFRTRYEAARSDPRRTTTERVGLVYEHTPELTFTQFVPSDLSRPHNPWRRFEEPSAGLSITLATYQLDNTAAASRMADLEHPCFTTRLALSLLAPAVPAHAPLVFIADRAGRFKAPHARARPVLVRGTAQGTETAEVLLASADFCHVYAHGWVDTHPM